MLGFDYFTLLDLLTIARSRKHIEKYYGTAETGPFPGAARSPSTSRPTWTWPASFPPIRDINHEIRRLNLAAYAPLRYVLPHKQEAYDKKYSTEIRGRRGLLPAGGPRGEPDPPAARQRAQAHGELGRRPSR